MNMTTGVPGHVTGFTYSQSPVSRLIHAGAGRISRRRCCLALVTPVVRIGDSVIGDGKPGPMTRKLQALYLAAAGIPV